MSAVMVKICGVRDEATAIAAARAGADFVGVVFVPSSPRFVEPQAARRLATAIAEAGAKPVAVVRLPLAVEALSALGAFPIVQFHGGESPSDLVAFGRFERWKGLHFSPASVGSWRSSGCVERLVVDGPEAGSGERWDLAAFAALDAETRGCCLLAGGLDPLNVAAAVRAARPWGVDVSSGVERARGVKDHGRIAAFVTAAKSA